MQIKVLDLCLKVTRHGRSSGIPMNKIQRLSQIEQSLNRVIRNYLNNSHPEWIIIVKLDGFYPVFTAAHIGAHGLYTVIYHYIDNTLELVTNYKASDSQLATAKSMLERLLSMTTKLSDSAIYSRDNKGHLIWA